MNKIEKVQFIINKLKKQIETLKAENEELTRNFFNNRVAHQVTQDLWSKTLEENTKLKEQLKEACKNLKDATGQ